MTHLRYVMRLKYTNVYKFDPKIRRQMYDKIIAFLKVILAMALLYEAWLWLVFCAAMA